MKAPLPENKIDGQIYHSTDIPAWTK